MRKTAAKKPTTVKTQGEQPMAEEEKIVVQSVVLPPLSPIELPDELNVQGTSGIDMQPIVNEGLHGLWVTDEPNIRTKYMKMGVHLVRPGEGLVPDESMYGVSDSGYLWDSGDSIVGVIKQSAYDKYLAGIKEQHDREMADVQVLDEGGVAKRQAS